MDDAIRGGRRDAREIRPSLREFEALLEAEARTPVRP